MGVQGVVLFVHFVLGPICTMMIPVQEHPRKFSVQNVKIIQIALIVTLMSSKMFRNACSFTVSTTTFSSDLKSFDSVFLRNKNSEQSLSIKMSSSGGNFYDDFGDGDFIGDERNDDDDDDEDDDDDDDEYADLDVASFMSRMENIMGTGPDADDKKDESYENSSVDELISFATSANNPDKSPDKDWAKPITFETPDQISSILSAGAVLVANPVKFCSDFEIETPSENNKNKNKSDNVSPALLSKFGLTLPPPQHLGPDRRADLLPVLVLLERHAFKGCQAVLMNRRTGYLIGDLEQEKPPTASMQSDFNDDSDVSSSTDELESGNGSQRLWAFMIQPLWFGGTASGDSGGLDMLHPCSMIPNSKPLTEDGLYWGGDPGAAQQIMDRGDVDVVVPGEYDEDGEERKRPLSGFDFKFFVQRTRWLPTQLEKEVRDQTWFVANVSKEVLFKSRDRLGTKRAKPLWSEIMELMGGEYKDIRDQFYETE